MQEEEPHRKVPTIKNSVRSLTDNVELGNKICRRLAPKTRLCFQWQGKKYKADLL